MKCKLDSSSPTGLFTAHCYSSENISCIIHTFFSCRLKYLLFTCTCITVMWWLHQELFYLFDDNYSHCGIVPCSGLVSEISCSLNVFCHSAISIFQFVRKFLDYFKISVKQTLQNSSSRVEAIIVVDQKKCQNVTTYLFLDRVHMQEVYKKVYFIIFIMKIFSMKVWTWKLIFVSILGST